MFYYFIIKLRIFANNLLFAPGGKYIYIYIYFKDGGVDYLYINNRFFIIYIMKNALKKI